MVLTLDLFQSKKVGGFLLFTSSSLLLCLLSSASLYLYYTSLTH